MEHKWLEDLVVLAETRSFSRAALMRNITQPAFSRRIQALEAWMGVDLIVRSSYPPSLTPAGEKLEGWLGTQTDDGESLDLHPEVELDTLSNPGIENRGIPRAIG